MDLAALLKQMQAAGFDGNVVLELYRDNYGTYSQLADSYRQILGWINMDICLENGWLKG